MPITAAALERVTNCLTKFILSCTDAKDENPLTREGSPRCVYQNALRELGVIQMLLKILYLPEARNDVYEDGMGENDRSIVSARERERKKKGKQARKGCSRERNEMTHQRNNVNEKRLFFLKLHRHNLSRKTW